MSKTFKKPETAATKVARATKKTVVWSREARRDRKTAKAELGRMCRTGAGGVGAY